MPSSIATLALLRDRLEVAATDTTEDVHFQYVLDRATARIFGVLGYRCVEQAYTAEYHDGNGAGLLILRHGPIKAITNVWEVTYDAAGGEALSTMTENSDYMAYGMRDEADYGRQGRLRRYGSTWLVDKKNYKVSYEAGWDQTTDSSPGGMPADLVEACLHSAIWQRQKRKDTARESKTVGSATSSFKGEKAHMEELRHMVARHIAY